MAYVGRITSAPGGLAIVAAVVLAAAVAGAAAAAAADAPAEAANVDAIAYTARLT